MIIKQEGKWWRIYRGSERVSQVFKTRKDAQRYIAKRRAERESYKAFWKDIPSIGEILDRQNKDNL